MIVIMVVPQTDELIKEWEDMLEQVDKIDFVDALVVFLDWVQADQEIFLFPSLQLELPTSQLDFPTLKQLEYLNEWNFSSLEWLGLLIA